MLQFNRSVLRLILVLNACILLLACALPACADDGFTWKTTDEEAPATAVPDVQEPVVTAVGLPETGEKQVLICLAEDLPGNAPYNTNDTEYNRNVAIPVMSGAKGFRYKTTTQSNYWLFPVSYAQGTPVLYLSLEGIRSPTSISINNVLLSRDRPVAVPLKETADLRVANARTRGVIRLMFTTLPIVQAEPDGDIFLDRETPCTITVFDPDFKAHGFAKAVNTYDAVISRRGRSSARYAAKHPYNLSLMKDDKKYDQSLLGLRNDSDWLLDSAYNDRSRMRNRVLMDVWHEIYRLPWDQTLSGATKGVYVELFVGDAYRGLYVLGEKQDRRQLGLAKTGGKWVSTFFRTGAAGKNSSSPAGFISLGKETPVMDDPWRWYNIDLRYPKESEEAAEALWEDFYDYVRLVVKGSPEEFAAHIFEYADPDNLARYWLFANAADITDNMRKNMSFARLDDRDPRFNRYILVPWDMDSSLGRYYTSRTSRTEELVSCRLFDRLIDENPDNFRQLLYSTWQELRVGALSTDAIMTHFDRYYAKLSECGADEREIGKFPNFTSYVKGAYSFELNFEAEIRYIRKYTDRHLTWLDGKIRELCGR